MPSVAQLRPAISSRLFGDVVAVSIISISVPKGGRLVAFWELPAMGIRPFFGVSKNVRRCLEKQG